MALMSLSWVDHFKFSFDHYNEKVSNISEANALMREYEISIREERSEPCQG